MPTTFMIQQLITATSPHGGAIQLVFVPLIIQTKKSFKTQELPLTERTADVTHTVDSVGADSRPQQQAGLPLQAQLGHVMKSIHVVLQREARNRTGSRSPAPLTLSCNVSGLLKVSNITVCLH